MSAFTLSPAEQAKRLLQGNLTNADAALELRAQKIAELRQELAVAESDYDTILQRRNNIQKYIEENFA